MDEASIENDDDDESDGSSSASSSIIQSKHGKKGMPPIRKGSNGQAPVRRRSVSFEDERTDNSSQEFRQRGSSFEAASSSDGYDSSIMRTTEVDNTSQDGYVASDGQVYNYSHNEADEDDYDEEDDEEDLGDDE